MDPLGMCLSPLSRKITADRECWSLAAFSLVDHLCITAAKFIMHSPTTRRHAMVLSRLWWIAANRPVQFASIDFNMRAPVSSCAANLGR
jgi:hypothetical protein